MFVVQSRNGGSEWFDTSSGPILSAADGNVDLFGSLKGAFDIVDLGGALSQIGPLTRVVLEPMLICPFCAPNDAGGASGGVQAGVRSVACMSVAKLAMYLTLLLTGDHSKISQVDMSRGQTVDGALA